MSTRITRALYEAVTGIREGNLDGAGAAYLRALWNVVRYLDPEVAERVGIDDLWQDLYVRVHGCDPGTMTTQVVLDQPLSIALSGGMPLQHLPAGTKGQIKGSLPMSPRMVGVTFDDYPERSFGITSSFLAPNPEAVP